MESTAAPSPTTAVASPVPAHRCLNCGTSLTGRYCSHCGQPADTHRITLGHWLHDIPHSVWHVDRGLPHTIREMLLRPGHTLRSYLAGHRAPYFRPLTYVLLVTSLVSLLYVTLHLQPYNTQDPNVPEAMRQMQARFLQQFTRYLQWFTVLMLPITAGFVRLLLRRTGYNYAECITIEAFVVGTSTFLNLLFLPFLTLANGTRTGQLLMVGVSVVMFAYQSWAFGDLMSSTGLSAVNRYLRGFAVSLLNYLAVVIVAMIVLFALNWSYFMAATRTGSAAEAKAPQEVPRTR